MNRLRAACGLLICASLLTLTACSDAGDDPTAAAAPTSPAPAATATFGPADDGTATVGDKAICEQVKTTGEGLKASLVEALSSGQEVSPAVLKKSLTNMSRELTSLAAGAQDNDVAAALRKLSAEAARSAATADPANAASTAKFEGAGAEVTTACKKTGVDVDF